MSKSRGTLNAPAFLDQIEFEAPPDKNENALTMCAYLPQYHRSQSISALWYIDEYYSRLPSCATALMNLFGL